MIRTKAGLPNSCAGCGQRGLASWWAESEDHARAGVGYCEACLQGSQGAQQAGAEEAPPAEREDWLWTGLRPSQQAVLAEHGITAAWLLECTDDELEQMVEIRGVGPAMVRDLRAAIAHRKAAGQ